MKKQLLFFALMLLPMMANAFTGEAVIDGIKYYIVTEDKTAEVRKNSYSGEVIIPETIEYEGVTCNVTSIGYSAFSSLRNVTSVTIPNSVTSIGERAFLQCSGLTSITIPNSVTSIGNFAFYYCDGLTSANIGNHVTSIGNNAFQYCRILTSVIIPNSITSISNYAFDGCYGLTSVTIPNSVTSIGNYAFEGCRSLTSITIPNSVTSIGDGAFNSCSVLTSVTIPNSVTAIGKYVFGNCSSLTSVTIPNSVTSIGDGSFANCSSLPSIIIPNSVTTIGGSAFSGCSGLTSVTIGSSVTSIGNKAFTLSEDALDVFCYAEVVPTTQSNTFDGYYPNATLHVPATSLEAYQSTTPWSYFLNIVPMVIKCATPTITYANGKVRFACETDGVEFLSSVTCTPNKSQNGDELDFGGTFTISVYATKEGYSDSDAATMTINMGKMGDFDGDGQLTVTDVTSLVNAILGK